MAKLAIVLICTLIVCQGYGKPLIQDGDIGIAAANGDWTTVQRILQQYVNSRVPPALPALTQGTDSGYGTVQANAPTYQSATTGESPRGRYYTQSEYKYALASNNNGKISEDKGGLGVIDNNGQVTYYKPTPDSNDQITYYKPAPNNGYNYAFSPYG